MTPTFRLLAALGLAIAALLAGLAPDSNFTETRARGAARLTDLATPPTPDTIDSLVQRTFEAGLFPNAELYEDISEPEALTVDEIEAAFATPDLVAFVKVGETWAVYITVEGTTPVRLRAGEIVGGDWQIDGITATSLTISRAGETRLLEAFPARGG